MDDETKVTSEFAMMNLNKPDDINPGLTNLNLNIMFENDINLIQDAIAGFEKRLQDENAVVHNVLNSMIAIIKSKFPRSRIESRFILETVLQKDDMNLNALADLEHLCRTFHRVTEADRYKERIDTIMKGRTSAEKRAKAVCLMEQGYAILYEESANKEQLSRSKLSESYLMLLSEHRKGTGKRRDHLQRCIYHNKQTLEQLQQAMECKRQSDLHTRRTTTIEKFDQAKTIYDLQSEYPVWLYYEGVAWNRKYDSLKDLCNDDEVDRKYDKMHATIKATKLLWSVATRRGHFDETFTLYQSRAFAHIAHILTVRDRNKDLMTYYKNLQDSSLFLDFLKNPRLPIDRALNSHGNDVFILNRYGRILWNESKIQTFIPEKKDLLHQAQQALNKSLRQSPSLNWFAFTTRMTVRSDLATLYLKHNKPKAHTFFKLALEDGYQCYMTKGTSKTLCLLVQVCQYLAKFPNIYEKGFRYVVEHGYLLDALDYLHFGVHQTGPTNYYIAYHMGTILYDLNELKSAVDWMKRAFSLSNSTNTMPCKLLCLYILSRYVEERAKNGNTVLFLKDFLFTLVNGANRYRRRDDIFEYLCKYAMDTLVLLFTDIFAIPRLLDQTKAELVSKFLNYITEVSHSDKNILETIEDCRKRFSVIKLNEEIEPEFSEKYQAGTSIIPVNPDMVISHEGYLYDFFVSHSHKDSDWVTSRLLTDLESAFTEEDVVFKGCIADRDFIPGKFIFENIEESIMNSAKILLVLSKNFLDSYWCQFETNQALISSFNTRKDCVIPLLLEECEIPDKLLQITYADFRSDAQYVNEIMKLKRALLPG